MAWNAASSIAYPALEVAHIVGIAILVGNLTLFEARVWGFGAALPLPALGRLALTLAVLGFGLAASTGAVMFSTQAAEFIANRAFVMKMALLALAGANAGLFHARDGLGRADRIAKAQTVLSLGLWLAIIACGRWIAYV